MRDVEQRRDEWLASVWLGAVGGTRIVSDDNTFSADHRVGIVHILIFTFGHTPGVRRCKVRRSPEIQLGLMSPLLGAGGSSERHRGGYTEEAMRSGGATESPYPAVRMEIGPAMLRYLQGPRARRAGSARKKRHAKRERLRKRVGARPPAAL